ncbi:MAG: chemotaxis protein CheA [Gammaproteobacteria bacterium]|nr:chemotaxis protein CheA [Gammaproteobacteria bacterium]
MDEVEQLFINESRELLEEMESCMLEVDSGEALMSQHIDAIFRAAHTIKGSAGLFGFDSIVAFTHKVESVLEKVRSNILDYTPELSELMFKCHSHMGELIDELIDRENQIDKEVGLLLLEQLDFYLNDQSAEAEKPVKKEEAKPVIEDENSDQYWFIQVNYGEDVFRDGMDPMSHLRYLDMIGKVKTARLICNLPDEGFDPEVCYLSLIIAFESDVDKQKIESVFEFIQENSEVIINTPKSYIDRLSTLPSHDDPIGQVLVKTGIITEKELTSALTAHKQESDINKPVGSVLVEQGVVKPEAIEAALSTQNKQAHKRPQELSFLKVESRKLDGLISLIGEMVTSGSALDLEIRKLENSKLDESFSTMLNLIEKVRDGALQLRMVQVGDTFNRLKRIVRDVSKELGKDIKLSISGAETELDKTMIEKLSDPLMHIVRNAIDHGIESKDVRTYKGKPEEGSLELKAFHDSGAVVIEIIDDGAGLDSEKILAKAYEKGIIKESDSLSKEQIYKLIFAPGFSTAAAVTNLSGRGVGMDVVKRNIEDLKGQIDITSELGKGTTFRIRLPLTLAIIDGFNVSVGDSQLIIPLNLIQECISFSDEEIRVDRNFVNLRGDVLPFIELSQVFKTESSPINHQHLVVVKYGNRRAGIVVDELHGELQAVIKPLSEIFRSIRGIGGSTILGTGEVGFILDIPQLVDMACEHEQKGNQMDIEKSMKA